MTDLSDKTLGETSDDIVLETSEENRDIAVCMINQGTRYLDIYSQRLDSRIYAGADFSNAVRHLAIQSPHAKIRFLLKDHESMIRTNSPLLELSRRLASRIEFRKINRDYAENTSEFVIVDQRGLLHRHHGDRYEGIANFNLAKQAMELTHYFNEVWERSSGITDARRLHI